MAAPVNKTKFMQDINAPIKAVYGGGLMFSKGNLSNVISVDIVDDGQPFEVTGTVVGKVIRSDGTTVPVDTGAISGNTVSLTLTEACFDVPGQIVVNIIVTNGDVKCCVLRAVYTVVPTETSEVVDPGDILPSIADLINDIDAAVASIPADYSGLLASIAGTFSTSTAYAAGAYVWYDGTLYRFTAAHASGSWTGSDAKAVTIGGELAGLQSAFDESAYIITTNGYNLSLITNNRYIRTTGAIATGNGRAVTEFINGLRVGKSFSVTMPGFLYRVFFYRDTDLSTFDGYDENYYPCDGKIYFVGTERKYRLCFYHNPVDSVEFTNAELTDLAAGIKLYDYSKNVLEECCKENAINSNALKLNVIDSIPFEIVSVGLINRHNGETNPSGVYKYTNYIPVGGYRFIFTKLLKTTLASTVNGIAFYDAEYNYLSGGNATVANSAERGYTDVYSFEVPQNAVYMRMTVFADAELYGNNSLFGISKIWLDSKNAFETDVSPLFVVQGNIVNGSAVNDTTRLRTPKWLNDNAYCVYSDYGYTFKVVVYSKTTEELLGYIQNDGSISDTENWMSFAEITDKGYYYRIVLKNNDNSDVGLDESVHLHLLVNDQYYNISIAQMSIPETVSECYSLFDTFVTAGFATKSLMTTVDGLPMYRYDFEGMDKWAEGNDNHEHSGSDRLFEKKQFLITSGMHGNEKSAVMGVYSFLKSCCYDEGFEQVLAVYDLHVIPICNPTGYEANTRNNYQDININRLDESSDTLEAKAILEVVNERHYNLYIDAHNCMTDLDAATRGPTGAMSFANAIPEADMIKYYRKYMKATVPVAKKVIAFFGKVTDNKTQLFYPWEGTTNETFRNYCYAHEIDGTIVGADVSACLETSAYCWIVCGSARRDNGGATIVTTEHIKNVFMEFLFD